MASRPKAKKSISRKSRTKVIVRGTSPAQKRTLVAKVAPERPLEFRDLGAKADAPEGVGAKAKSAHTIIYVHGIANKPIASVLKCQWDMALTGTQLGDRSRMAYWVNREYYPTPLDETCADSDLVSSEIDEGASLLARAQGLSVATA